MFGYTLPIAVVLIGACHWHLPAASVRPDASAQQTDAWPVRNGMGRKERPQLRLQQNELSTAAAFGKMRAALANNDEREVVRQRLENELATIVLTNNAKLGRRRYRVVPGLAERLDRLGELLADAEAKQALVSRTLKRMFEKQRAQIHSQRPTRRYKVVPGLAERFDRLGELLADAEEKQIFVLRTLKRMLMRGRMSR